MVPPHSLSLSITFSFSSSSDSSPSSFSRFSPFDYIPQITELDYEANPVMLFAHKMLFVSLKFTCIARIQKPSSKFESSSKWQMATSKCLFLSDPKMQYLDLPSFSTFALEFQKLHYSVPCLLSFICL
ncbi:hypothetical protein Fmac_019308 [Flemingia macrophylla]|uniref:Uncharacterized protein n=1 Tax=Flemingia macrophylla TaxID=520843 RepID=A0ABD1M7V5_9FABA